MRQVLDSLTAIRCALKRKLAEMEVDVNWLPDVCTGIEKLGTYRGRTVTTAIGDNQASFLGAAGDEENILLVNMGTGGTDLLFFPVSIFREMELRQRPFLNRKYLLAGASLVWRQRHMRFWNSFPKNCKRSDRTGAAIIQSNGKDGKNRERPE